MTPLEQAKTHLEAATTQYDAGSWNAAEMRAQFAQAAALIAIAERLDKIVSIKEAETGYWHESEQE